MQSKFKPNLFPNNEIDYNPINWEERIVDPHDWLVSEKYDGIRVEIFFDKVGKCEIKTRSLKPFRSKHIKSIEARLHGSIIGPAVIEGEIYCDYMRFNELQHFILSEDVTSIKAIRKTAREQKAGKFSNRSLNWLTTYAHDFRIKLFDMYLYEIGKEFNHRLDDLFYATSSIKSVADEFDMIDQIRFGSLSVIQKVYEGIVKNGGEGLLLKRKDHKYKLNRNTLKEGSVFKMKDEFNLYLGVILDVVEGTEVDPLAEKTINELGYSVTSKSIFDRNPSGMAKGFRVRMKGDINGELIVTLKGFNNMQKELLLANRKNYINKEIEFVGMKPTKVNGMPRQAKYINK